MYYSLKELKTLEALKIWRMQLNSKLREILLLLAALVALTSSTCAALAHTARVLPELKGVVERENKSENFDLTKEMAAALESIQKAKAAGVGVGAYEVIYEQAEASIKAGEPAAQTRMLLESISLALDGDANFSKLMIELTGRERMPSSSADSLGIDSKGDWVRAGVDFGPYMRDLQRRIKRVWYPPKSDVAAQAAMTFKIFADGHVSNLKITKHSGSTALDLACFLAVKNAAPFLPLPKHCHSSVNILFEFRYNVLKNGSSTDK